MAEFTRVGSIADYEQGVLYDHTVDGKHVIVVRNGERFYAMRNACTHAGYLITPGTLYGERIHCPAHGAWFRLEDGEALDGPAADPLEMYEVRLEGDDVLIGPAT